MQFLYVAAMRTPCINKFHTIYDMVLNTNVGTFPVVALMVGTAVLRLSNCDEASDGGSANEMDNSTTSNVTCEHEPVDIAVTLSLMVGILMVNIHV